MIQLFRNFFKSKIGLGITLGFVLLIALAFGLSDIGNNGTFGGVAGGDRVAVVGEKRIDTSDLFMAASNAVRSMRQEDPTLTAEAFVENDGMQQTLDSMLSRASIAEYGRQYGLRAGSRLIDSEIVNTPEFRTFDGSFDTEAFRTALRQQGITEEVVRDDLGMGLLARQQITPLMIGPRLPASVARRYASLLQERRTGSIGAVLAPAYAPEEDPSDEELQAFYSENRGDYIRPERRVIRFASFGEEAFANLPAPTPEQIAERYEQNREEYAAQETRSFTQLVVPTQAAAQAVIDEVNEGANFDTAARNKGLATTRLARITREDLAAQTSAPVASAGFAAANGNLGAPAQGNLGWYVLRVDSIDRREGRTLAQASAEISATLANEQRRFAMNEATVRIEDEFDDGKSLSEVAEELGIEISSTPPITADGQVYGTQNSAPQALARIIPVAFEMEQAKPQLAETVPGQVFMIYDVARITPSATAPLEEIREQVETAWRVEQSMTAAGEAALRIMERVEEGSSLAEAIRAEEVRLPNPERLEFSRQEVAQMGQLPPALALYFSMAEGTVKRLESPQTLSWFVIQLDDITAPEVADDDPIVLATIEQLQSALGQEYAQQFVNAAEAGVSSEVNDVAVDAVAAQLTGRTN